METSFTVINGVKIQSWLLGLKRGRKNKSSDGLWWLYAWSGGRIVSFATEAELDAWWQALQIHQGREPTPLAEGPPPQVDYDPRD
jgi:hypothetical protein